MTSFVTFQSSDFVERNVWRCHFRRARDFKFQNFLRQAQPWCACLEEVEGDGGGKRGWRREREERNDERERERITEGEGGGSKGGKMEGTGKVRGGQRD